MSLSNTPLSLNTGTGSSVNRRVLRQGGRSIDNRIPDKNA